MRSRFLYCLCSIIFGLIGFLLTIVALLLWAEFDSLYGGTVREQMSIDNQSMSWWFDKWRQPPVKHLLTIHVFELENVAQWRRSPVDTRPLMREIGPFVFRVEKRKEEWNFTDVNHHQVRYNERTSYHFDELLSYQSLDTTAVVANAELMVISPFVTSMAKRVASVSRISRSLNTTASQILTIFRTNLYVERSIGRIIFGPSTLSKNFTAEPDAPSEDENEEIPETNSRLQKSAKQEMSTTAPPRTENPYSWVLELVRDNATLQILTLYQRAGLYFQRLGVELNPFELIAAQFVNFQTPPTDDVPAELQSNSILAFYQNNSFEQWDLWTGKDQPGRQAKILRFNDQSKLQIWSGKQCNEINGTDGRQFSPFLKRRRVYLYESRSCRSIPFTFTNALNMPQGVDVHRYSRASDFLLSPTKSPSNSCFCRTGTGNQTKKRTSNGKSQNDYKGCNYDGILDLGVCYGPNSESNITTSGAVPLVLTAVHFSGPFTKSIAREIRGVVPDEQLYLSLLDIEPVSGIVLHRTLKYQFNLHFLPLPTGNRSSREVIVPLLWQDEQFTVNADHLSSIKYLFVYPTKYREFAMLGAAALGAGTLFLASLFMCCCCCSKPKPGTSKKEQLINEETGKKGSGGKRSGKVSPIEQNGNGNAKAVAWSNDKLKNNKADDDDGFQFEGEEDEDFREEDDDYDPKAVIAPNNQGAKEVRDAPNPPHQPNPGQAMNGRGGNQYPLERLKRDMPARQSAQFQQQFNQRRQWNTGQGPESFDSYGGNGYHNNQYAGYDPNGPTSFDVFGDNHFANPANGEGGRSPGPPPPPPPPPFGRIQNSDGANHRNDRAMVQQGGNDARDSLLRQIRAGTQLRHNGDQSSNDDFDRQMAMTSVFIIQQLLAQQHEQARWQHIQSTQDALAAQMMRQLLPYVSLNLPNSNQTFVPAFHHEQTEAMLVAPNWSMSSAQMLPPPPPLPPPHLNQMQNSFVPQPMQFMPDYEPSMANHLIENRRTQRENSFDSSSDRFTVTREGRRAPDLSVQIDDFDDSSELSTPDNASRGYGTNSNDSNVSRDDELQSRMIETALNDANRNDAQNSETAPRIKRDATGRSEAIRFYGPYRAYNASTTKINESMNAERDSNAARMEMGGDDGWESEFDDDDDIDCDHNGAQTGGDERRQRHNYDNGDTQQWSTNTTRQ